MNKIKMYVEAFGGTYVGAYEELLDSGDVRESDSLLARCSKLDRDKAAKGRAFLTSAARQAARYGDTTGEAMGR